MIETSEGNKCLRERWRLTGDVEKEYRLGEARDVKTLGVRMLSNI